MGARGATGATGPQGVAGVQGSQGVPGVIASVNSIGSSTIPSSSWGFIAPTVTVALQPGQRVHITSYATLGTTANPAGDLDLSVCYRLEGSTSTPTRIGLGAWGMRIPAGTRLPFGLSAVLPGTAAGTYNVGLCGTSSDPNWVEREWGYTTALVLN